MTLLFILCILLSCHGVHAADVIGRVILQGENDFSATQVVLGEASYIPSLGFIGIGITAILLALILRYSLGHKSLGAAVIICLSLLVISAYCYHLFTTLTDFNGYYCFTNVPAGEYRLSAFRYHGFSSAAIDKLCVPEQGEVIAQTLILLRHTSTPTATFTPRNTPTPTQTSTIQATLTPTNSPTSIPTNTPSFTPSSTVTSTASPTSTPTVYTDEFIANPYTPGSQVEPDVAVMPCGGFIIAWSDQEGFIKFRLFDDHCAPTTGEIMVNASESSTAANPRLAADSSGRCIVAWQQDYPSYDTDCVARIFDQNGVPSTGEFMVDPIRSESQLNPDAAWLADGNIIVVWQHCTALEGCDIYHRVFNASGDPLSQRMMTNQLDILDQAHPAITSFSHGGYAICWDGPDESSVSNIIYCRIYETYEDASDEFIVNENNSYNKFYPALDSCSDGNFVIVWQSNGQDGDQWGIFGRLMNDKGHRLADEFQVNVRWSNSQKLPAVSMDSQGNFLVSWTSYNQDGDSYGIYRRLFRVGSPNPPYEELVNQYTSSSQTDPMVALSEDGFGVHAWSSYGQDGDLWGIIGRKMPTGLRYQELKTSSIIE